jgi:hypothetical protein
MSKMSSQTMETGRDATTRGPILSESTVRAMVNSHRDYVLQELVPLALRVVKRNLKSRRPNLTLAIEVLKGAQVHLTKPEHGLDGRRDRFSEMTDDELDEYIKTGKEPQRLQDGSAGNR